MKIVNNIKRKKVNPKESQKRKIKEQIIKSAINTPLKKLEVNAPRNHKRHKRKGHIYKMSVIIILLLLLYFTFVL